MKGARAEMLPLGADKTLVRQHKYDREIAVSCKKRLSSAFVVGGELRYHSLFEMQFVREWGNVQRAMQQ